jgi:hypothetical protein
MPIATPIAQDVRPISTEITPTNDTTAQDLAAIWCDLGGSD